MGKNISTTTQTETNILTDNSANVAEGGVGIGSGANVNIQTTSVDKDIALGALGANQNTSIAALAANQNTSIAAIDTTGQTAGLSIAAQSRLATDALAEQNRLAAEAFAANRDVNLASLDTTSRLAANAINSVVGIGEVSSRERIDTLESTNLALQSNQGLANKFSDLAGAALERSQTPDSAVTKNLINAVVVIAVVVAAFFIFGRKKK